MSRKLITLVCTLCLVCGAIPAKAVNPDYHFINGGFETGDLTGWWTSFPDATTTATIETWNVDSGTYAVDYVCQGNSGDTKLGQSITITAGNTYTVNAMYDATNWGGLGVAVNYYDSSWSYLNYSWLPIYTGNGTDTGWTSFSGTFTPVAGAAYADVTLNTWGWATTYVDNVSVTPEPATMVLLGIGGLVALRRKHA
jgi:hypothetical protein